MTPRTLCLLLALPVFGCSGDKTDTGGERCYQDLDEDGYGDPEVLVRGCGAQAVDVGDDCDDGDDAIYPGATETCDGRDQDCDGEVDEDAQDVPTWYADTDGDGYGNVGLAITSCGAPDGYVADAGDQDDDDPSSFPGAAERCDGVDNDGDGESDEDAEDSLLWYADADGDGFGDASSTASACEAPDGYVADSSDCNDGDASVHPGVADDDCDGVDSDCDGTIDQDGPAWYPDEDGDGYGDPTGPVTCDAPRGYVEDSTDCDDTDVATWPGAEETCDGKDNDCDDTDGWTEDEEYGVVSMLLDDETYWTDLSETLAAGTESAPLLTTLSEDGELVFCDGTWYTRLYIDANRMTVRSLNGSGATELNAAGSGIVVTIGGDTGFADVVLEGLTITGGDASDGAGLMILQYSMVEGEDLIITGNTASNTGGGVYATLSSLELRDSTISANSAVEGGGLYLIWSDTSLYDVSIDGNSASSHGGGISNRGETHLSCEGGVGGVTNNSGGSYAGGVYQRNMTYTPSLLHTQGCLWSGNVDQDLSYHTSTWVDVDIGSTYGTDEVTCYGRGADVLDTGGCVAGPPL